jgi:hypothetical protein
MMTKMLVMHKLTLGAERDLCAVAMLLALYWLLHLPSPCSIKDLNSGS